MIKKVLLGVVVLLVVAVVLVLTVEFDSPKLGNRILAAASETTGMELSAEAFRLKVLHGIVLEGVEARMEQDGGSYHITLDRLVFEHRPFALLTGTVAVDRLLLIRPRVEIVEGVASGSAPGGGGEAGGASESAATTEPAEAAEPATLGLALTVGEVVLEDGYIQMSVAGQETGAMTLEGLQLTLRELSLAGDVVPPLASLAASGNVAVEKADLDGTVVRDTEGRIVVEGGRFTLEDLRLKTDQGPFAGRLEADLGQIPMTYAFRMEGSPLDFHTLLGAVGKGFGAGTLVLEGAGAGSDTRTLEGQGSFQLAEGTLPGGPYLAALEQAIGPTKLLGAAYPGTGAGLSIRDNKIHLKRFQFETAQLGFNIQGWVDLGGPMEIRLELKTPRQGLNLGEDVPPEVIDVLTDEEGWVVVPVKLFGTPEAPQMEVDTAALKALAKAGVKRVVTRRATEELLKLLVPDDD
jgi:type II secretion system protein N